MKDKIESLILFNILTNEDYTRKVLPFIKHEYFTDKVENLIFTAQNEYISKYNSLPTKEAILIAINSNPKTTEDEYKEVINYVNSNLCDDGEKKPAEQWLLENTEDWCQQKAIYECFKKSIEIVGNKEKYKKQKGEIPKLVNDAFSVCFSTSLGHDYIEDADIRFDFYKKKETRLPFDLEMFNKITGGGVTNKSLNIIVAGTGAGKSLCLCHFASSYLISNKKVLYITLEMSEEKIAERIDANLLNVPKSELASMTHERFSSKINSLKARKLGKLIIEEYPTAGAHVGHFRNLLQELSLKKNFKPDVIIIDYLNICTSSRVTQGGNTNLYSYVKNIAEEIRGLAMEFDVPIFSATQTNRQGQNNTDIDYENVSESHGLSATADLMIGMMVNEELDELNQVLFKQIKNRYNDVFKNRRFVVGADRDHMRLYDVEQIAQKDIADSGQEDDESGFDKTSFGSEMKKRKDFSKIQQF